jgi:hypothetical protein
MLSLPNKNYRTYLLIAAIVLFSLFALYLRLIPMLKLGNTDILNAIKV